MIKIHILFVLMSISSVCLSTVSAARRVVVDICVYGGTSSGVIAAYAAKQMGKSVVLIEPSGHIGGLTTGGLGFTDIGNKSAITGIARDFYRRIGARYNKFEHWVFEPKIASAVLSDYMHQADLSPYLYNQIVKVNKKGAQIVSIETENAKDIRLENLIVEAKQFIDCSYEGDLMAKSGVSYHVGRESNAMYGEEHNGVQLKNKHQFPDGIDPYRIKGDPSSGLLWGISSGKRYPDGSGDSCVQAYNYRICLTNDEKNRIEITEPDDYTPERYELLLRYLEKSPARDLWAFLKPDRIGNGKTDLNNNGPFSTDMIGMNHRYPNASYAEREKIKKEHENYTKGLLYFIGNDSRMPENLREQMQKFGYPKDEYVKNGHWSPQMYVREVRRMQGEYVMTQANCQGKTKISDGIGMAAYTMDSHNCQRLVINGMVKNEGDVQVKGFPPYPISYRALLPKAIECSNLLVPVCLSASHIAYGSIRMEPVFMVLGQSAAVAAVLSIDKKCGLHQLDARVIQTELLENPLATGAIAEIIIEEDNTDCVTVFGDWKKENRGYGGAMLVSKYTSGEKNQIIYRPVIKHAAIYRVYAYLHSSKDNAVSVTTHDGRSEWTKNIKCPTSSSGQHSSGDWALVGDFFLSPDKGSSIIMTEGKEGRGFVADALLLIPIEGKLRPSKKLLRKKRTQMIASNSGIYGDLPLMHPNGSPDRKDEVEFLK